jgi:2-polyprenyl-3-methyl-5-hydroxy-6-metoxy-1,4-benzoquinol methylase
MISLEPMLTPDEAARLYDGDYFDSGLHGLDGAGASYETMSDARAEETDRFLAEVVLSRNAGAGSLFEIGAAMGHLLAAGRRRGLRCGGLEISAAAVARARDKFGLELIHGGVETADLAGEAGRWDVVYAGDVLEHLVDPGLAVAQAARLLRPGGVFVVRLPSSFSLLSTRLAAGLLPHFGGSLRLPDKPYHLHEFGADTARRLLGRGFAEVEVVESIIHPRDLNVKGGSAAYRLKHLLHWCNLPVTRLTGRFGDRLTLWARAS